MATGDMFLKLEGIEGESPDEAHKTQIQILSFSWGVSNSGSGGVGSGSGVGKASLSDVSVMKLVDKSSPNLFINCCTGKHISKATIYVRKAGEKPQEYETITMDEVLISSFQQSASDGGGLPTESVSLNFSKIKFEYKAQKADGTLDAAIPKTYDVKANVAS